VARPIGLLLRNPYLLSFLTLYVILLGTLHAVEGFGLVLPLLVLLIMGMGFSALAWWTTRRATPPSLPVQHPRAESGLLGVYLVFLVGYLTWGANAIEAAVKAPAAQDVIILAVKLALFVALPLILFSAVWQYSWRDFFRITGKGFWQPLLVMSLVLVLFQLVFGQGLREIRAAGLGPGELAWGIPFVYAWLVVEVGLVEEFFFRGLLQSRLSALLCSELAGVVVMAVLFGLAHAPGIYFRTSQTLEGVGPSPSVLMAVGYSVVVIAPTGFFLGTLWARTRNLVLLALIHAAGDLIPNLASMVRTWHSG
jgi:membrane protease YdiL (CAAX protease family)